MDLKELINELINSNVVESQELGVTLLDNPDLPDEVKMNEINKFISKFKKGDIDLFSEESKGLLDAWIILYNKFARNDVRNRVKKII